jgi:hypothetical protein
VLPKKKRKEGRKKERNLVICKYMDEPGGHDAK